MPNPTFHIIAERWLSESAGSVNVKTIEYYSTFLERYVFPTLGDSLNVTEEDVRRLMDE